MRFVVASFLVLSNFCALSAEPLTPMLTQRYLACNASQGSAAHACRARCDEAVYECLNRKCIGQSCPQQCGPTHSACLQSCIKSAGC
jgi:hypothetical protein